MEPLRGLENGSDCTGLGQELLPVGTQCWVLHPKHGNRPVGEGIAGGAPQPRTIEGSVCRTLLMELFDEGNQTVQVTKIHRKNTDLMHPVGNASSMYLDDFVVPPAPTDTYVTWGTVWLVEQCEMA